MAVKIQEHPTPTTKLRHFTITITPHHKISTTVTSTPSIVRNWLHQTLRLHRHHRSRLIVGLGVQWTPHSLSLSHRPAATIQLCIGRNCLIFHLHHSPSSPNILRRLLSDHRVTFVGLWCHSDAGKLLASHHQLAMLPDMPIDLRTHVVDHHSRASLRGLTIQEIGERVLGVDVEWDMEISRSNWEVNELSVDQICQAAIDAFVSFAIGMHVRAWTLNPFL